MVYTGNYSSVGRLRRSDKYLVQISLTKPSWADVDDSLPVLFPDSRMLWDYKEGEVTDEEYTRRYLEALEKNKEHITAAMSELARKAEGKDIVLLCWCGRGKFCHRRLFARWWEERTGESIEEI